MKNLLFFLLSVFLTNTLISQDKIWETEIEKKSYFKQLEDGNLFVRSGKTISLLDSKTGEKTWSHSLNSEKDPKFFDELPIMYLEGGSWAVIDGLDGNIITQSDSKTEVKDIHYYWDVGRIVCELIQDKKLKVFNLNLNDLSKSWTTEIGKAEKTFFGLVNKGLDKKPIMTSEGEILIVDSKSATIIDRSGSINKSFDFNKKVKVLGQNPEHSMVYLRESKKDLHFIDIKAKELVKTVTFEKKLSNLQIINNGLSLAVVKKKNLRILNGLTGEDTGEFQFDSSISEAYLDEESGKFLVIAKKELFLISQKDGSILETIALDSKFTTIYPVNDRLYLGNGYAHNELDRNDLSTFYEKSISLGVISDYVDLNNDITLYITSTMENKVLSAYDKNGKKLWSRNIAGRSNPSIDFVSSGILVIGESEANFYNSKTGKSAWKDALKVEPSFTYVFDDLNNRLIMFSEKRLHFFDFATQGLSSSPDKFKFKDFDFNGQQPQIVPQSENVFVKGSLSVYVTDKQGVIEHKKDYKKSDNTSGWLKLANAAVTIGAVATGNGEKVLTVYSGNSEVYRGSMVNDLNSNYAYAEGKRRERQEKQNKSSNRFPYIYTKLDSGEKGIVFINPKNGDHISEIEIVSKDPNYIVDEVDGVLFYENNGLLIAYQVETF